MSVLQRVAQWTTASSRSGRALRTALVSMLGRGLSILGTLVTIPLVLNYLGPERYGLWMTLSVIFIYLRLADGGVTIALISLVAQAHGMDNNERIRALFSSAFAITAFVAVGLILPLALMVPHVNWNSLLNLNDPTLQSEASSVAVIIILSMAASYPAGVVRQGRLGLQQGAEANTWDLAATLITFIGQIAVVYSRLGLVALAAVTAVTPVLINSISSIFFLLTKGRAFQPQVALATWPTCRNLFASGSVFMALLLTQALSVQIDQVLIARLLGVGSVADYSVVQKLMTQPQLFITMILTAQFPAYGEALTRGDHTWIVRQFKMTLAAAAVAAGVLCLAVALLIDPILKLWIGNILAPSSELVASMAVYGTIAAVANVFTYFFFSLGLYRRVILAHIAMIAINIPLSLYLIPKIGSAGACLATSAGFLIALVIPSFFVVGRILQELPTLGKKAAVNHV